MKVLIVCLGNICRSPIAEGILQIKANEAGLNWQVSSAGTNGYHVGEAPHHFSQKVAKQHGVDISCQVAQRFTASDFKDYDRIYAMANDVLTDIKRIAGNDLDKNKIKLFLDELFPGQNKDVPDPWYGGEDGYHDVYGLIDATCEAIIQNYLIAHPQIQKHK